MRTTILLLGLGIISGQLIRLPFLGGGITLLDLTVVLAVILSLIKNNLHSSPFPLWIKAAFILLAVMIASLIFSPLDLNRSQFLTSFAYIVRFALYIFSGWLIFTAKPQKFSKVTNTMLITSGTVLAILGLLQLIFIPDLSYLAKDGWDPHYFRTSSTFLDPNFLGVFLVLIMLISFPQIKNFFQQKLLTFSFIVSYLALATTFSRSSALMFLVSFLSLAFLQRSTRTLLITIILFLGILASFSIYTPKVAEPRGVDRQKSAEARFTTWQAGFEMFQKAPLLGVGFNSYRFALEEYKLAPENLIQSHGGSSNDSSLLHILATTGIVGFIVYLFFLGTLTLTAFKNHHYTFLAGLLGLLASSFFINNLFYSWNLLWISLIINFHQKISIS